MLINQDYFVSNFPKELRLEIGSQIDIWLDSCLDKARGIFNAVYAQEKHEHRGRKTLIKAYTASDYNILCFVYNGRVHKKAEPNLIIFFRNKDSVAPDIIGIISPRDSEVNSSFLRSILEPIKLEEKPDIRWSKVLNQIIKNLSTTYARFDRVANTIIASKSSEWNLESEEYMMRLTDNQIDYILEVESD